jgi:transcriptional regulator with AAA-type ATPase domain
MNAPLTHGIHLDGLLQGSGDPFFAVNARRCLVFVNRACAELLGVPAERLLGLECKFHGPQEPGDLAGVAASLCPPPEALAGQPARTHVLVLRPDGERLWRSIQFLPCAAADGALALVLGRIGAPDPAPVDESAEPLAPRLARLRHRLYERYGFDHIVAASPAMQRALDRARLASTTRVPVLFVGEAGTGKETLARTVHYQGADRHRAFVALDCAKLPPPELDRLLSEDGLLGPAGGSAPGVIYLREPQRLAPPVQARLSAWLDRGPDAARPRVMAGSTGDLVQAVRAGEFLDSLYHRLSTLVIEVPALRDRGADLPLLVQQILERCNARGTHQVLGVDPAAWELIRAHAWPGNVAELHALITEAHARARHPHLQAGDLPAQLRAAVELARLPAAARERPLPLDQLLNATERRLIELALRQARGNKSKAAARLQISRARLYRCMEQLGIEDVEGEPIGEVIEQLPAEAEPEALAGGEG